MGDKSINQVNEVDDVANFEVRFEMEKVCEQSKGEDNCFL
jgi:hypothetical protein